mmetsp:Transcript_2298/g.9864  ORF Transcript_2298/g.9864 Transcript_2298/m.9864 type:complete len:364 (+) Transcript_2298:101-1192(+)
MSGRRKWPRSSRATPLSIQSSVLEVVLVRPEQRELVRVLRHGLSPALDEPGVERRQVIVHRLPRDDGRPVPGGLRRPKLPLGERPARLDLGRLRRARRIARSLGPHRHRGDRRRYGVVRRGRRVSPVIPAVEDDLRNLRSLDPVRRRVFLAPLVHPKEHGPAVRADPPSQHVRVVNVPLHRVYDVVRARGGLRHPDDVVGPVHHHPSLIVFYEPHRVDDLLADVFPRAVHHRDVLDQLIALEAIDARERGVAQPGTEEVLGEREVGRGAGDGGPRLGYEAVLHRDRRIARDDRTADPHGDRAEGREHRAPAGRGVVLVPPARFPPPLLLLLFGAADSLWARAALRAQAPRAVLHPLEPVFPAG